MHTNAPRIIPPKNESPSNFRPLSSCVCFAVVLTGFGVGGAIEADTGRVVVLLIL